MNVVFPRDYFGLNDNTNNIPPPPGPLAVLTDLSALLQYHFQTCCVFWGFNGSDVSGRSLV